MTNQLAVVLSIFMWLCAFPNLAYGTVIFNNDATFTVAPKSDGAGSLQRQPTVPPTVQRGLIEIDTGYKWTNEGLIYDAVQADQGKTVTIDWVIDRQFSIEDEFFGHTRALLEGEQIAAGIATDQFDVTLIKQETSVVFPKVGVSVAQVVQPPIGGFKAGPNASQNFMLNPGIYFLRQTGEIKIDFANNLPANVGRIEFRWSDSVQSEIVPEPSTLAMIVAGLVGIGFARKK